MEMKHHSLFCPWIDNRSKNDEEKTIKYGPLRWELKQPFPGYKTKQHNIINDVLGGWLREVDNTMIELFGEKGKVVISRMQKAVISWTMNIACTFKINL